METFTWQPSKGIDSAALTRIRRHFPRPKEPMGEAWFMSEERRMFPELMGDLAGLPAQRLQEVLVEIASGTSCFGRDDEWTHWYHYLLGQLLTRSHDSFVCPLLESLVTGFIALYPIGIDPAPYPEFADDALATLGLCMMEPHCWAGREIVVGELLHRSNDNPARYWGWASASGDFSASMFFCLKYLPTTLVRPWLQSVLDIPSPHWRAQILVWLVGAHDLLTGAIGWPSQFPERARPDIGWDWSHCLDPELTDPKASPFERSFAPMLSEATRTLALQTIREHFTADVFLDWLATLSAIAYLTEELMELPSTFERLYVKA